MSVMPAAVWYGGSVKVSSGFMNASFGRWCSLPYPVFMPSASLLITVFFDASLPAAGMVRTTAMGSTFALGRFVVKSSHTSSSMQAPFAIAFAESMTDPPPTASTQSTPSFLHRATPSRTSSISGFGRTPPSFTHSTPAASSDAQTRSMSPLRTALCPPKCTSTFFAPRSASLPPTFSSTPRPKTNCVGDMNSKSSMETILSQCARCKKRLAMCGVTFPF